MREPFDPVEPEWLIRAQAGLPPIKKTSELPQIIPPLPKGDTSDLKVWKDYWVQHDAQVASDAREQVLDIVCSNDAIEFKDGHIQRIYYTQLEKNIESLRQHKGGTPE